MPKIGYSLADAVTPFVAASAFAHGILESAALTTIVPWPATGIQLENFPHGTLFGRGNELRWRRRRDGLFHLVQIWHDSSPSGSSPDDGFEWQELTPLPTNDLTSRPAQIVLWGEPVGEEAEWAEGRIPRIINEYPKELKGKRTAIQLAHYMMEVPIPSPLGGQDSKAVVTVSRFVDIVAAQERQR